MGSLGTAASKLTEEEEERHVVLAEVVIAAGALPVAEVALALYPGMYPVWPKCHSCHQCHPLELGGWDSCLVGEQGVTPVLPGAPHQEPRELFESEPSCLMDLWGMEVFNAAVPARLSTCPRCPGVSSRPPPLLAEHRATGPAWRVDGL